MNEIEKQIITETKGLPPNALSEILTFIQFVKHKQMKKSDPATVKDDISIHLQNLSSSGTNHLEEEFRNYKELYPREE